MGSLGRLPLGVTMAATAILDYPALRRPPSRVAYFLQFIRPNDSTCSATMSPPRPNFKDDDRRMTIGLTPSPRIALPTTAAARGLGKQSPTASMMMTPVF